VIAGVLLAAGESTRMGRLKALLPWRGTTLLESQLSALMDAGVSPLVVVLGHRAAELRALLSEIPPPSRGETLAESAPRVVLNDRYRQGKSTSIVAGIAALPEHTEAALVVAVDQPTEPGVLRSLLGAYAPTRPALLLPSVNHRRGHPTLFDRRVFPDLLAITEEREGLREVMDRYEADIRYVEVETELVRANLNSPEEYQAAFTRWGQR
jgi:molybdenum cofactor cytidylyltransferase